MDLKIIWRLALLNASLLKINEQIKWAIVRIYLYAIRPMAVAFSNNVNLFFVVLHRLILLLDL